MVVPVTGRRAGRRAPVEVAELSAGWFLRIEPWLSRGMRLRAWIGVILLPRPPPPWQRHKLRRQLESADFDTSVSIFTPEQIQGIVEKYSS